MIVRLSDRQKTKNFSFGNKLKIFLVALVTTIWIAVKHKFLIVNYIIVVKMKIFVISLTII